MMKDLILVVIRSLVLVLDRSTYNNMVKEITILTWKIMVMVLTCTNLEYLVTVVQVQHI